MRRLVAPLALVLLAAPATAQERADRSSDDITVSATPLPPENATRLQARAVADHPTWDDAVPRVEGSVCVGVGGMSRPAATEMIERVGAIAETVGLLRDRDGCSPNLLVLLVDDPARDLARLRKANPRLFRGLSPRAIRGVMAEGGPVRAWNLTETNTRDGMPAPDASRAPSVRIGSVVNPLGPESTRLTAVVRRDITGSLILIRRPAVIGFSVAQLAAYVAMRGLAVARAHPALAVPSILTLFDPALPPQPGLTAFDRGYLRGLYQGRANRFASNRIGLMNRAIRQELRGEADALSAD